MSMQPETRQPLPNHSPARATTPLTRHSFECTFLKAIIAVLLLISPMTGNLYSQVLNATQAGLIEGGFGLAPNLTGASAVAVAGNYAYVIGTGDVLEILDVTLPGLPLHKGSLANGAGGAMIARAEAIVVQGNYAYITSYGANALEIVDVSDPANPVHKGALVDGGGVAPYLNQAWGLVVSGNYAYVTSAGSNALEIIDISNPARPTHKGSLLDKSGGTQAIPPYLFGPVSIFVSGNYAYIGSLEQSFEIVDISNPASPVHVGSLQDGGGVAPFLGNPYGVYVSGNTAYITDYENNALEILDVSNPALPVHKGALQNGGGVAPYLNAPFSVVVSGNYAFVANWGIFKDPAIPGSGNNSCAFEIIDVSNPAAPVHASAVKNNLHAAIPTFEFLRARSVVIADNKAYVTSRDGNMLSIVDVATPLEPKLLSSALNGKGGALLYGANFVTVSGNYAYVASLFDGAMEVVNISNPSLPVHAGSLMLGSPQSIYIDGNNALVADQSGVLYVVDISNPNVPTIKNKIQINTDTYGEFPVTAVYGYIAGNYAIVTTGGTTGNVHNSLLMLSPNNPSAIPPYTGRLDDGVGGALLNNPLSMAVSVDYQTGLTLAFVASNGSNALEIVNATNSANPVHYGSLTDGTGGALLNKPSSVCLSGNYAYVASTGSNALEIVDISDPQNPVHAASIVDGQGGAHLVGANSVQVSGNYAFVTFAVDPTNTNNNFGGLEIIDISVPTAPKHYTTLGYGTGGALLDYPTSVCVSGNYAYITNSYLYQDLDIVYLYGPSLASFSPTTGPAGTPITITGQNFNTFLTPSVNGATGTISTVTGTSLTFNIPADATIGKVNLAYKGQNFTSANTFIVTPTVAAAADINQTSFSASWSDVGATGYFIDLSTDNFNTFVAGYNNLSVGNVTNLPISGLTSGIAYQYRVRSTDGNLTSSNSNVISVTTTPGTPVSLPATAITQNNFAAVWKTAKGAAGYHLDVATDSTFTRNFLVGYNNLSVPGFSDTTQNVTGLNPFTKYFFRVRAFNLTGSSPSSSTISVKTPDNIAPTIGAGSTPNPTTLTLGVSQVFSAFIADNVAVDSAVIFYRGISKTYQPFKNEAMQGALGTTGGNFNVSSQPGWYDAMGMEYYFRGVDEAGNVSISPHYYAQLVSPSVSIPALPSGTDKSSYRIVAFPYQLSGGNSVTAVYANVPWNDNTKAGLWWWDPALKNSTGGYDQYSANSVLQTVDPGKGYWVVTSTPVTPTLSNVPAPQYNDGKLFTMKLMPQWNEIGNPYPVSISWNDVKAFNNGNFSALNIFTGSGYATADSLGAFQGGFVKNNTSSELDIQIPFPGQKTIGGRMAAITSDVSQDAWNISMHIEQEGLVNKLGGFGMHPNAVSGADRFDNFNPPRFLDVPEVNFANPDVPGLTFSNDMVKTQESYSWRFTPIGNQGTLTKLTWSLPTSNADKQLFLLDEEQVKVIDMTQASEHEFILGSGSRFSVFYGTDIAGHIPSQSILASAIYPNPLAGDARATTNLALPDHGEDYMVNLQVYNAQGALMATLTEKFAPGVRPFEFSLAGNSLNAGLYVYKLSIAAGQASKIFTGKIVKL